MKKRRLTICFLANAASIHTLKWAKYFADGGHNVHLISYEPFSEKGMDNINTHLLEKKIPIRTWPLNTIFNFPFTLRRVRKIIKELKPDIVHAHYITSYGHLAALIGFHPLIITAWGSDVLIAPEKSLKTRLLVKNILKKSDLITCDAKHMKEAIIDRGADPSKVRIIYFGVDTKKFSPGPKDKELKKKLGIAGQRMVISLRSLEPVYNIESLIKATPIVLKEVPDTKFIIIGQGSYEKELKKLVSDLKLTEDIKFVGFIPNQELPRYLRTADIYVSTSLSDGGIASSTAEAMSCGLPVVITDFGENKKWVENRKNGFIIPKKAPKILAEKITFLLKNENAKKEFGRVGRRTIKERNNYYKEMEKMEKLYEDIIKEN